MTTNSTFNPELLDQLLANYEKPEDLTGDDGLFKQLKKALIERALGAELTEHLGYEKGDPAGRGSGNSRNGSSSKTIRKPTFYPNHRARNPIPVTGCTPFLGYGFLGPFDSGPSKANND